MFDTESTHVFAELVAGRMDADAAADWFMDNRLCDMRQGADAVLVDADEGRVALILSAGTELVAVSALCRGRMAATTTVGRGDAMALAAAFRWYFPPTLPEWVYSLVGVFESGRSTRARRTYSTTFMFWVDTMLSGMTPGDAEWTTRYEVRPAADRDYRSTPDYSQVHDDYFVRLDEFPISAGPRAVEVGLQQIIDPIYHHKPVGGREAWWAALPPFLRLVIATYDAADVLSYLRGEAALR